jgi:hypothetical protein
LAFAAKYVLKLAEEVWENQSFSIAALTGASNDSPQAVE